MSTTARVTLFGTLYVILFLAAMYIITNGVLDVAAWASAPIVMSAEAMVLGMIYMTSFHGEGEEFRESLPPKATFSTTKQLVGAAVRPTHAH